MTRLSRKNHVTVACAGLAAGLEMLHQVANFEQLLLVLLYQDLVLSVTGHAMTVLTLDPTQIFWLERIANETMHIILGSTETSFKAKRYLLHFAIMDGRIHLARAQS